MDNIRDSLLRMYRSAKDLKRMYETFKTAGFSADSIFDIYGNVADAIYFLIGEHTERFADSITSMVLEAELIPEKQAINALENEFYRNIVGCKLNPINKKQFAEMYKANGGYMAPTPEGEWKK